MKREEVLKEKLQKLLVIENAKYSDEVKYIAGVDEAGRGPLAGPVVAAAVIMPRDNYILGIDDSKKISEKKREELFAKITENAIAYGVGIVDNREIDEINILRAARKAFDMAINNLNVKPDFIYTDAMKGLETDIPYEDVIKGDANIYSIAAASIIAKVTRDNMMREYDKMYPDYGFEKHKGYGTKAHYDAIREFGITPIHRKTFLKKIIGESNE